MVLRVEKVPDTVKELMDKIYEFAKSLNVTGDEYLSTLMSMTMSQMEEMIRAAPEGESKSKLARELVTALVLLTSRLDQMFNVGIVIQVEGAPNPIAPPTEKPPMDA